MLRLANSNDVDFVYEMYMHPTSNPHLLYEPIDKASFLPIYQQLIAQQVKFIFSVNGRNIGMVKLQSNTYRLSHVLYIGGLAIHPNNYGQGLGKLLLSDIIEFGKHNNYKRLELSVGTGNTKAIDLYEKMGFIKEGILRNYTYIKVDNKYIDEWMMSYIIQ